MMNKMLAGIEVITCFDYLQRKDELGPRKGLVYTGPIDAYFNFSFGKLRYRSQRRVHHYHKNMIWAQPYVQINYSNYRTKYIRAIEWKHLPGTNHNCKGTVQTFEYPFSPDNGDILEYPFPDDQNIARSMQYLKLLQSEKNVYARGRLAEYKYLDMDAAIDNARLLASRILRNK
jgi:UDP-galactopyranose mutase